MMEVMMDTLKQHRLEAIRALRIDYERSGDVESVALCDRALAGDEAAYNEMLDVVTDGTYGGPSEEEHAAFLEECGRSDMLERMAVAATTPNLDRFAELGPAENIWPLKRHFS